MEYCTFTNVDRYSAIYNRKYCTPEWTHYSKNKFRIRYTLDDRYHNIRGPAFVKFYENGIKEREIYLIKDKRHNSRGPAYIEYYENGIKQEESFYLFNRYFNSKGPASITYYENGNIRV